MPDTKSKADKPLPANKQKGSKKCTACKNEKPLSSGFYLSKSPLFSLDERVPICKTCVINNSLNEDGTINEIELNKILRKIDKPFFKDSIQSAINQFKNEHSYIDENEIQFHGKELLQNYFKLIAMRQDRFRSYEESEKMGFMHQNSNRTNEENLKIENKYSDVKLPPNVANDIPMEDKIEKESLIYSSKWKGKYTATDIQTLDDYYNGLDRDYKIITANHRDYARKIAKASLQMDKMFDDMMNGIEGADKKYENATKAFDMLSKSAKFSESTRSVNDVGISSFSKVAAMVESHNWIPTHKPLKKDTIDEMIDYLSTITKSL